MERTESTVVSVAPDFENDKIKEMAFFGWNLQGRQEIVGPLHEQEASDNLFTAVARGVQEGATGRKTLERDHYVKLHFVRSLELPNLARIKQLEAEFHGLPVPVSPGGLLWPIIFTLIPIPGAIGMLSDPMGKQSPGLIGLIVVAGWIFLGLRWIKKRRQKRNAADAQYADSRNRAAEIFRELPTLIDVSQL